MSENAASKGKLPATIVLCLNVGSSSLKSALYRLDGHQEICLVEAAIEGIGQPQGRLWIRDGEGTTLVDRTVPVAEQETALGALFDELDGQGLPPPDAIGHRLVHGGPTQAAPRRIDDAVVSDLQRAIPFAPLHLPAELAAIAAVTLRFPHRPQVACFDTAFHQTLPDVARRFPLPDKFYEEGLYRYGFHGLSYEYVVSRLGSETLGRAILAHLGSGASLVAIRDGKSVDTTMGFTPTGGIMMGTRSGDLDPGLLLHLLRRPGGCVEDLERLVTREAGLRGVSGSTADVTALLAARSHDTAAARAIDLFCYQVKKSIGALAAVLGGLDTLVFTGGIGEHAAPVRAQICDGLTYLGIQMDVAANEASAAVLSPMGASCVVRMVPTNEALIVARHTRSVMTISG